LIDSYSYYEIDSQPEETPNSWFQGAVSDKWNRNLLCFLK